MPQIFQESGPASVRCRRLLLAVAIFCLLPLSGCDRAEEPGPGPDAEDQADVGLDTAPEHRQDIDESAQPGLPEGAADPELTTPPAPDVPRLADTEMEISEPSQPDGGRIEGGEYHNDFFGFNIALPDQWVAAAPREFRNITSRGTDLISGEDDQTRETLQNAGASPENFQLLIVSKLPFDSTDVANPSIMIIAEKVTDDLTGEKYLQDLDALLGESLISYSRQGEIGTEDRGGVTFHMADYRIETPDATLLQSYIVTVRKGYALAFIITDTDRASLSALREFALNADFDPANG